MARFPTTPLLRDFNEADHSPDSEFTVNPNTLYGTAGVQVLGGVLAPISADAWIYRNVSQHGPDSEVYATDPIAPIGEGFQLLVKCAPVGNSAFSGYILGVEGGGDFSISRRDAVDVTVLLAGPLSVGHVAGDGVGLQVIGSSIRFLHRSGGPSAPWDLVAEVNDSTYAAQSGYICIYMPAAITLDDLGGGTHVPESGRFVNPRRPLVGAA